MSCLTTDVLILCKFYDTPPTFCWYHHSKVEMKHAGQSEASKRCTFLLGNELNVSMHNWLDNFLTDGGLFSAKSTELLPNSQEGSKKVQSVHSSANQQQKEQSMGPTGFGDGEDENLPGLFIFNK